jgi:hypothetical protein
MNVRFDADDVPMKPTTVTNVRGWIVYEEPRSRWRRIWWTLTRHNPIIASQVNET